MFSTESKTMKTESTSKNCSLIFISALCSVIITIGLIVFILSLEYQGWEEVKKCILPIIIILALVWSFPLSMMFTWKKKKLKFSPIMGPSTWSGVSKYIEQKGKGWGRPTLEELKLSGYSSDAYASLWSSEERKLNQDIAMGYPYGDYKKKEGTTARFILVLRPD
jgi:hypothetical protein